MPEGFTLVSVNDTEFMDYPRLFLSWHMIAHGNYENRPVYIDVHA